MKDKRPPEDPDSLDSLMARHIRRNRAEDHGVAASLLRMGGEVGPQTREALADLLEGKLKRPAGRQVRTAVDELKDAHIKAPLALMLIDGISLARKQGRDLRELPHGGPERGEGTREYVARLLGMSESSLDALLARTKGVGWDYRKP